LVDQVVVIYNARMMNQWSALGKSIPLGGVEADGQTYCNRIYIRGSYRPNDLQQVELLAHELVHSRQCRDLGGEAKFGFHYFREYKRAGLNYANNKLEREADSFANQIASSFRSSFELSAGVYRLADGAIFSTNGRDAYCTYQNMDHFSFAADKSLRPATSFPSFRNDGPCPVILPVGNYRQPDGLIFYSNGRDAFCSYRRVPGGSIRQLNGPVPYDRLMRNDGVCAGQ
jgi:hypothetical protein